jgi:hypothetical protein
LIRRGEPRAATLERPTEEAIMRVDLYTKVVLTLIACGLLIIAFRVGPAVTSAAAQAAITCEGQLKANAKGGTAPGVGGYRIEVSCR